MTACCGTLKETSRNGCQFVCNWWAKCYWSRNAWRREKVKIITGRPIHTTGSSSSSAWKKNIAEWWVSMKVNMMLTRKPGNFLDAVGAVAVHAGRHCAYSIQTNLIPRETTAPTG